MNLLRKVSLFEFRAASRGAGQCPWMRRASACKRDVSNEFPFSGGRLYNSGGAETADCMGAGVLMSRDTLTGGQWEPLKRNPDVLRLRNLGMFE